MVPAALKVRSPLGTQEVRFTTLDQLIALNPRVVLRNNGDEAIEVIRVETRFTYGFVDAMGLAPEKQRSMAPWVLKQTEREDHQLPKKLLRGQRGEVSITRGLVAQMVQAQTTDKSDRDHYGRFEVRCYGRIVGGTAFDESERNATVVLTFCWVPNGFPEEKCRKVLESFQPLVNITD